MKTGFRLEQVLNLRKEVEKQRNLEFVEAKREFEHAVDRLTHEERAVDSLSSQLMGKQSQGISADELQMYSDFFQRKRVEIKEQKYQVDSLNVVVSEKRENLMEAARDKKVLEALKEKKLTELKRELAGREQAFLDEISIQSNGVKKSPA